MAGPPARYMPFNLFGYLLKAAVSGRLKSERAAEALARKTTFDVLTEDEREAFSQWKEKNGVDEGQLERELGKMLARSVAQSWRGFLDLPEIYHFGWEPTMARDVAKSDAPVLIVSATEDNLAPLAMAKWLANYYPSAKLKMINGGHFASFFVMDDIWREVMDWSSG